MKVKYFIHFRVMASGYFKRRNIGAWKYELTVEEFLKATIGHEIHHMNIIKSRYLNI